MIFKLRHRLTNISQFYGQIPLAVQRRKEGSGANRTGYS